VSGAASAALPNESLKLTAEFRKLATLALVELGRSLTHAFGGLRLFQ
jgi:hypothetical protein